MPTPRKRITFLVEGNKLPSIRTLLKKEGVTTREMIPGIEAHLHSIIRCDADVKPPEQILEDYGAQSAEFFLIDKTVTHIVGNDYLIKIHGIYSRCHSTGAGSLSDFRDLWRMAIGERNELFTWTIEVTPFFRTKLKDAQQPTGSVRSTRKVEDYL